MVSDTNALLQDLLTATQILVNENVLDGFGHVSARDTIRPTDRYFMIRENLGGSVSENNVVELDLDSNPIRADGPSPSIERFIHGEIYRARPDVNAIVHTHAPYLIPFGVTNTPLRPLYHMCGFLHAGAPVFDIAENHGVTNMLITSNELGRSLAASLGKSPMVLMRGHGASIVGASVKEAVFRAVYATLNAHLQPVANGLGDPCFLADEESILADQIHQNVLNRPWDYWKSKLGK